MKPDKTPPKVFLSYSWTSPPHEKWVIQLATELCESGVDVILDKWDLKEGHDKFEFMENIVTDEEIKKVVMICDKEYTEKADNRQGGVGAEAQIITPALYEKVSQDKFVAVVTEKDDDAQPYIPKFCRSRIFIDFSDEVNRSKNFEQLLRWIFDKPLYIKPRIGKVPSFIENGDGVITLATSSRFRRACDAVRSNRVQALALVTEYFETVTEEFSKLRIRIEEGEEIDEIVLKNIESFIPYRNEIVELLLVLAKYYNDDEAARPIHRFLESIIPYMKPAPSTGYHHEWEFDNYKFLVHELYLYTLASFIKHERFNIAKHLMITGYYLPLESGRHPSDLATCDIFSDEIQSLDYRNHRLKLQRVSVRADLLRDRVKGSGIRFGDLMQADFVLFLRNQLDPSLNYWFPETLLYACYGMVSFEIFVRSESASYFEGVKTLLGVADKNVLGDLLSQFHKRPALVPRWQHYGISPRKLLAYDRLASRP